MKKVEIINKKDIKLRKIMQEEVKCESISQYPTLLIDEANALFSSPNKVIFNSKSCFFRNYAPAFDTCKGEKL